MLHRSRSYFTSRKAFLGLAACLFAGFSAQPVVAESSDSVPQLLSTTNGKGRSWATKAELKNAADAGDAKACLQYGDALLRGEGMARDAMQAVRYLTQAAEKGEPNASFRLGKLYDDGELAPKDYVKAFDYYTEAAKAGVCEAQYNLGVMHVSGRGVKRDYVEGLAWLILATKNGAGGDGEKQTREHLTKNNRQKQITAAEQRAAEIQKDISGAGFSAGELPPVSGPVPSILSQSRVEISGSGPGKISLSLPSSTLPDLGKTLEDRRRITREQSPPVSLVTPRQTIKDWPTLVDLRDEADKKNPVALWGLGKVYFDGTLVPYDPLRALKLFEEAAAAGNVDAAYQLGEMYSKDTYVAHDDAKVFAYFKQSALGLVRPGFYNLGVCYVNGRGITKDLIEGMAWLILAKKHNVDPRTEGRIRLQLEENDPVKIPLAEKRAEQLQKELFPQEPEALALPTKK